MRVCICVDILSLFLARVLIIYIFRYVEIDDRNYIESQTAGSLSKIGSTIIVPPGVCIKWIYNIGRIKVWSKVRDGRCTLHVRKQAHITRTVRERARERHNDTLLTNSRHTFGVLPHRYNII